MEQLLAHLVGDFFLQTDYMALNKKAPGLKGFLACYSHCYFYMLPFLVLTQSIPALLVIMVTHFIIDRGQLVPWLIWLHNLATPPVVGEFHATWQECKANGGYHPTRPAWVAIWLCIITDNTLHLLINYAAIRWL